MTCMYFVLCLCLVRCFLLQVRASHIQSNFPAAARATIRNSAQMVAGTHHIYGRGNRR